MINRLRQAEVASLTTTALAFLLTIYLLPANPHVAEMNPAVARLFEIGPAGWAVAGAVALVFEAIVFAAYERVEHVAPRTVLVGGVLVATVGVFDLLVNLRLLSVVGIPESVNIAAYGLPALAVAAVGAGVGTRRRWGPVLLAASRSVKLPSHSTVRAVAVSLLLIGVALAGVYPFVGPIATTTPASAAPSESESGYLFDFENDSTTISEDGWTGTTGDWSKSTTSVPPDGGERVLESSTSTSSQITYDLTTAANQTRGNNVSWWHNTSAFDGKSTGDIKFQNSSTTSVVTGFVTGTSGVQYEGSSGPTEFGVSYQANAWHKFVLHDWNLSNDSVSVTVYNADNTVEGSAEIPLKNDLGVDRIVLDAPQDSSISWKVDEIKAGATSTTPDLAGHVTDQSGTPVDNATVKVVSYDTADFSGTSAEIQSDIDRVKKRISNPEPPEWDPDRTLTGSDSLTDVDGTYAIAHSAEKWNLNGFQLGGGPTVIPDPKLSQPAVTLPAEQSLVVSLWDATDQDFVEDSADADLPGATTSGTVVVERLDAAGDSISTTTRQTQPMVQITSATNLGTKTHEAVAFPDGLSPGFYRIYPEGHPDRAYTLAVAPDANVNKLKNTIIEGLKDRQGSLTERAQNLEDYVANNKVAVQNTTTNETGYYSFSFGSSTVTEATVVAYKKPDAMSASTPSRGEIVDYYESQLTESVETTEGVLTCESGIGDLGSYYAPGGQAQVDIPDGEADLDVVKVGIPDDLPIDQRACLEQELLSDLRNSSLADYAPFIRQNLDDLSREELDRLLTQLGNGALTNERLCKETLSDLGVSATSECGASQDELNDGWIGPVGEGIPVNDTDQIARETVEQIVRSGTPNLGSGGWNGGGGGGGGGSPTVSPGDIENTISGTFPFPGVNLVDESVVTVRAHLTNGTTKVYNLSSEYVSVERRTVRPDVVRVEDLPIGDVGGAELAVDVVTPDTVAGASEPITNPDFSGSLPALRAVKVSAAQPGPEERIEVGVDGEAGGKFGKLLNVTVIGPSGQLVNTTNVTEDAASFSTNGSGRYKVRLTMTNPGGQEFVEVVGVVAGEQSRARPPTLRGRSGPLGTFAVVSDGLESGDLDVAAAETQLRVAAIIGSDADVPPSIHLHTQAIDTADDYTTTARVLRAPDQQAVNKRTTIIHHGASVPEDAIIYRQQTQPLPRNETNEYGRTRYQPNQSVVESYSDAGGSLSVRRITDPGLVDEAFYQVRLRTPAWVPITTAPLVPDLGGLSGLAVLLLDLGGVLLLALGRRRGRPSRRTLGVLLVAGALVTAPVVPLQAGTGAAEVDLSPADDGLFRTAEKLPENVQRYGTDANPGWVVKIDTADATNGTAALRDWINASDERALIDAPDANGYAVVSAPRGDVGVTLLTRTLNSGLTYNGYVESVQPEMTMSVPEPNPLVSNATWSPTLTQQITEWTTRGDNFGVEGVAWREDVNESTMQEARQATRSDTLGTSANGTGVTVAVLDTGVNTQSGQVFGNGSAGSSLRIDNASKNFLTGESVNATAGDYAAVADGNGHGTWVASAIGSAADEPYRGYAPDANLLVLKVLGDDGSGSTHSIAEAVRYAAEQDADVISMSLGAPTYSAELAEAVANATEQGSVVVIAAGNSRQTTRWVGSPADTPVEGILTVGAASVNTNNTTDVASTLPASFSQIGPDPGTVDLSSGVTNGEGVDLVSPGMMIAAATPTTSGTRTNTSLSGTSMATPQVAGGIAQVLDERPGWKDSPERVAGYARNTTRVVPNGSVSAVGNGYLAVDRLAAAEEHDETQAEARTDGARARDAGWRTLSNGSGGFFARFIARTAPTAGPAGVA